MKTDGYSCDRIDCPAEVLASSPEIGNWALLPVRRFDSDRVFELHFCPQCMLMFREGLNPACALGLISAEQIPDPPVSGEVPEATFPEDVAVPEDPAAQAEAPTQPARRRRRAETPAPVGSN